MFCPKKCIVITHLANWGSCPEDGLTCRLLVAQAQGSNKLLGVGQIGVRVAAAKVRLGVAIQQRALGCSELLQQQLSNMEPPDILSAYSAKISAALPSKQ